MDLFYRKLILSIRGFNTSEQLKQGNNSYLSEVTWMVLIEKNSMMVLATCVTATTWMFTMLADTTMTSTYVTTLSTIL
jgi:hypothetical protein